ncbi:MAG: cryptochrome/photolyase family protein, partial [Candidatus Neomarinimicrobiota bacterium]
MEYTLIYPNQLFPNHPSISRNRRSILIEEPLFFGDIKYPVKYHKKKLALHHISMRRYLSEKLQDGYEIEIVNYSDLKIK